MSYSFKWCKDRNKIKTFDKQVFCIDEYKVKRWYLNGKLHRGNGSAIEYADGGKYWYLHGKYHREDGPACEYADGDKEWYLHGKLHRINGPAVEYSNGTKYWYLNGKIYCESDYWKEVKK